MQTESTIPQLYANILYKPTISLIHICWANIIESKQINYIFSWMGALCKQFFMLESFFIYISI